MGQKANNNIGRQSSWGTILLTVFLAATAYFLFTEHRAHLWIGLPLLAFCAAMLALFWRATASDRRNRNTLRPNHEQKGELR